MHSAPNIYHQVRYVSAESISRPEGSKLSLHFNFSKASVEHRDGSSAAGRIQKVFGGCVGVSQSNVASVQIKRIIILSTQSISARVGAVRGIFAGQPQKVIIVA